MKKPKFLRRSKLKSQIIQVAFYPRFSDGKRGKAFIGYKIAIKDPFKNKILWVGLKELWDYIMEYRRVYCYDYHTNRNITGLMSFWAFNNKMRVLLKQFEKELFFNKIGENTYINNELQHYKLQADCREFYNYILKHCNIKEDNKQA